MRSVCSAAFVAWFATFGCENIVGSYSVAEEAGADAAGIPDAGMDARPPTCEAGVDGGPQCVNSTGTEWLCCGTGSGTEGTAYAPCAIGATVDGSCLSDADDTSCFLCEPDGKGYVLHCEPSSSDHWTELGSFSCKLL
jgi:hypothetical protein